MPKVKPTDLEERRRIVRACIASNMELYRLDSETIAARMGFAERTFRNKRENPETFTMDELWKLSKILKFTPIQNASILAGQALTSGEVKKFILL